MKLRNQAIKKWWKPVGLPRKVYGITAPNGQKSTCKATQLFQVILCDVDDLLVPRWEAVTKVEPRLVTKIGHQGFKLLQFMLGGWTLNQPHWKICILSSELEPPIFPESIGVKSCHHHEVQYKASRSTRFHKSKVLCVLRLTCDSTIELRNMFHPKNSCLVFAKKICKKLRKKKTSNTQNSFPNGTLPSNFGVSSRRVPGGHRHELQLEAHDHQIKPRGWFQPSARPRWFVGPQDRSPELTNCLVENMGWYWRRWKELRNCRYVNL